MRGFESFVVRPAGVLRSIVRVTLPSIRVDELSAAMLKLAERKSKKVVSEN
jgi:hypothetical protein